MEENVQNIQIELNEPKLDKYFKCKPEHVSKQVSKKINYTHEILKAIEIKISDAEGIGEVVYFENDPNVPHLTKYFEIMDSLTLEVDIISF